MPAQNSRQEKGAVNTGQEERGRFWYVAIKNCVAIITLSLSLSLSLSTDFDEDDSSSDRSHSVSHSRNSSPHPPSVKKRKKAQRTSSGGTLRVHELKAEARRGKREKEEGGKKNVKKKVGF